MGLEKVGTTFGKELIAWTRTSGSKSLLTTKPMKVNTSGLKYAPKLEGDIVNLSRECLQIPSKSKLEKLISEQGLSLDILKDTKGIALHANELVKPYITENNSLFLEELIKKFPLLKGKKVNYEVQRRMLYLADIDHSNYANKKKFLENFLRDVDMVDNIKTTNGEKLYTNTILSEYSKKAILQAKYNNAERYKELSDLLKLYKQGKVPEHCMTFFPQAHFHNLPKGDIERLLNGEAYYRQFTNLAKANNANLEIGEAFSIAGIMHVKTPNGIEKLKMDNATYERLFPAIERYSIAQGNVENCVKIASYNAMIKHPLTRIELYRVIEQTPNGVRVNIPRINYCHDFDWNNLSMLTTGQNLQGGLGHKMIEYTYDIGKFGRLRTTFDTTETPDLIGAFSGKYRPHGVRGPKDKIQREQFFKAHSNGIYIGNTQSCHLDDACFDDHACSWNNLVTGARQNPWTGLEEVTSYRPLTISGACVDL